MCPFVLIHWYTGSYFMLEDFYSFRCFIRVPELITWSERIYDSFIHIYIYGLNILKWSHKWTGFTGLISCWILNTIYNRTSKLVCLDNMSVFLLCLFFFWQSSEEPLLLSGLSGPSVLEVFATRHDIVVFNWPVYFSFACKIVVDLIKADIYIYWILSLLFLNDSCVWIDCNIAWSVSWMTFVQHQH